MKQTHRDNEDDQSDAKIQPIQTLFPIPAPIVVHSCTKAAVPPNALSTLNRPKSFYERNLVPKSSTTTRKCLFDNLVKPQYQAILREKVSLLCQYLRSVVVRTQTLANCFFITTDEPIPAVCFKLLLLTDATPSWRDCDNYKQQNANSGHQTDMERSEAVSSNSGTASEQHAIWHKRRDNRSWCGRRKKLC